MLFLFLLHHANARGIIQPFATEDLVDAQSFLRVLVQHAEHEILGHWLAPLPRRASELWIRFQHLLVDLIFTLALEGHVAGDDVVEDHSQGPAINLLRVVAITFNLFWCHVTDGSAFPLKFLVVFKSGGLSEIGKFQVVNIALLVNTHKNVVQLDIAVHNAVVVAVLQSLGQLLEDSFHFVLRETREEGVHVLAQVHVLCIRDDVEFTVVNVHVNKLDHIRMIQLVQYVYFLNYLVVVTRLHVLLLNYLDGDDNVQLLVDGKDYF